MIFEEGCEPVTEHEPVFEFTELERVPHEDRVDTYRLIVKRNGRPLVSRELSRERAQRLRPVVENLCREDVRRGVAYLIRGAQESLVLRYST